MVTAHEREGMWIVEVWDVFTNFNSLQPFEDVRLAKLDEDKACIAELKSKLTNNKEIDAPIQAKISEYKNSISNSNKWGNKRYRMTSEEFANTFDEL